MTVGHVPGLGQQSRLPHARVTLDDQHCATLTRTGEQSLDSRRFRCTTNKLGLRMP
jgi:hypothetical protein